MIAIIDYGAGNLFSVKNALNYLGISNEVTSSKRQIERADALILPGVGAFPDAMNMLVQNNVDLLLREQVGQKPIFGICLGMQLLFDEGIEFQRTRGLGFIPGSVVKIEAEDLKIPHMGWNRLRFENTSPILKEIKADSYVYFVHSYRAETEDKHICAYSEYGEKIPALVQNGFVYGAQFHPEKSGEVGLQMLKNFADLV